MKQFIQRRQLLGAGACSIGLALFGPRVAQAARPLKFEMELTPAEWRKRLPLDRYRVLRQAATESPGSSPLNKEHRAGTFTCAGCNLPLFASTTKFESHTGWPSFFRALPNATVTRVDRSLNPERTEVLCRRCGGHLGHVFRDGPRPTGLRYCMNGLALQFVAA
ncbi:MAG: peptide-methionine (R)-S-oxide reductase MsrB [Sphingomicrobium sp.]